MSVLNYANLDPKEFESLAKDVMEKKLGIPMERFGEGKDEGVDLTEEAGRRRIIVQCKRYLETGSAEAVRRLIKELPKVKAMNPQPEQYYIFTTASLMPQQVSYLRDCFSDYMESDANIIYREKIEDFFNELENVDILRKHLGLVDARPAWFKDVEQNNKISDYYAQEERVFTSSQNVFSGLEGDESLESAYIEAMTWTTDGLKSMLDAVEEWYDPDEPGVLLLHGQPGHGKTTFCRKAVFEFIRKRRFKNAKNVLWFSLNQDGLIDGNEFKISRILHPKEEECLLTLREAKDSIIFLDGYDEVKLKLQGTKYKTYAEFSWKLFEIAIRYKLHLIVTSRTNAVKDNLTNKTCYEFAPLTPKQQEDYCLCRKRAVKYWGDFLKQICTQPRNDSEKQLRTLMTIPFLFRIVVQQGYRMTDSVKNQAKLYEDLFNQIMIRHFEEDKIIELNRKYQQLAYDIWCNDEDTAESREDIWEELLFSYFMKSEKEKILGFVHRSIYQYYLALYFYEEMKEQELEEFLKLLAERRIDDDVLGFFTQIAGNNREDIDGTTDLTIPSTSPEGDTVNELDDYAFYKCEAENVTFSDLEGEIGGSVLSYAECKKLTFSNCTLTIDSSFASNMEDVEELTITDCDIEFEDYAFYKLGDDATVTISNSTLTFGGSAFSYAGIESITITDSSIEADSSFLSNCEDITNFTMDNVSLDLDDYAFYKLGDEASVSITNCSGEIKGASFEYGEVVDLTIDDCDLEFGSSAFANNGKLETAHIGNGSYSFDDYSFYKCDKMTSFEIGGDSEDNVVEIGGAFGEYCDDLTTVSIGKGSYEIDSSFFSNCDSLVSVSFNDSAEVEIDDYAFYGADESITINYNGQNYSYDDFCDVID